MLSRRSERERAAVKARAGRERAALDNEPAIARPAAFFRISGARARVSSSAPASSVVCTRAEERSAEWRSPIRPSGSEFLCPAGHSARIRASERPPRRLVDRNADIVPGSLSPVVPLPTRKRGPSSSSVYRRADRRRRVNTAFRYARSLAGLNVTAHDEARV